MQMELLALTQLNGLRSNLLPKRCRGVAPRQTNRFGMVPDRFRRCPKAVCKVNGCWKRETEFSQAQGRLYPDELLAVSDPEITSQLK